MSIALNDEQKRAVTHRGSPLLIVAGPGSGKTHVVVERILNFVNSGIKPSQILCLTFSEKATDEMKQRLEKFIDISDMQISTFHSFSKDLLQDNVLVSGIGMSAGVITRASQLVWGLRNIDNFDLKYIEIGNNAVEIIESMIDGISTFKDDLVTQEELVTYLENKFEENLDDEMKDFLLKLTDLAKVYRKYQDFQRNTSIIDFDDMVVEAINLLRRRGDILRKYQERYKHIFVDEFQDNNYAQLELVKLISSAGNVTAVGDDDQCIYRFQGAYLTNFKDFTDYFKNSNVINLNQNYRSTQNIVELASQLLEGVPNRQPKKLYSKNVVGDKISLAHCSNENAEVEFVIKKIFDLVGQRIVRRDGTEDLLNYKDFAILSRKRILGEKFASQLKARGIPAQFIGETNIFSTPIVRDFMCYLKIANEPESSGMEIVKLMKLHGISEQNIAKINHIAKKKAYSDQTNIDFVLDTLRNVSEVNINQNYEIKELSDQISEIILLGNNSSISEFVHKTIMSITELYKQSLISNTPKDRRNRGILRKLYNISLEYETLYPHSTLKDFLNHLTLMGKFDIELDEGYEQDNTVKITTIHQSKGKEYPIVFIVDLAENKLPLRYQAKKFYVPNELSKGIKLSENEKDLYLQEERRLLYVAMTRAQNLLFMTYAKKYGDNLRESKPSKFLKEINYDKNPLIEVIEFQETKADSFLSEENKIEYIRNNLQVEAARAIMGMNLKTALYKLIDLSKIEYFKDKGSLKGYKASDLLSHEYVENNIDNELKEVIIPLVNKENLKLSASKLETYKDCPLKFKFAHVLEVPIPPKSYFDLGTSIHSVLEHLTQLEKNYDPITEELAFEILEKEWLPTSFNSETEANQAKHSATEMIRTYFKWRSENPNKVVDGEQKFTIEIGGIPFNGSIDRVEKTPEGEYEVIDFKTGSVHENKKSIKDNLQMNVYALAIEKVYGKLPKKTNLFYLKKDTIIPNEVEPSHVNEIKKIIEGKVQAILGEDFTPTPGTKVCRTCDFGNICDSRKI